MDIFWFYRFNMFLTPCPMVKATSLQVLSILSVRHCPQLEPMLSPTAKCVFSCPESKWAKTFCSHILSLKRTQSPNHTLSIGNCYEQSFQRYVEVQKWTPGSKDMPCWSFKGLKPLKGRHIRAPGHIDNHMSEGTTFCIIKHINNRIPIIT